MIRKLATQYNMVGEITSTEDRYLKPGEALQELVNEVMSGRVRVQEIRFTDETIVIHLGDKSPIQQRHAYFVGDHNDMISYAKFAAYVAQMSFRSTDGEPYSYLTFGRQVSLVERETPRRIYGEEFASWYHGSDPAYVLFRAFGHLVDVMSIFPKSKILLRLETSASALALVLDGDATLDEALALAK